MIYRVLIAAFTILAILSGCAATKPSEGEYDYRSMNRKTRIAHQRAEEFLRQAISHEDPVRIIRHARIDSVVLDRKAKQLGIYFNDWFGAVPFREETVAKVYTSLSEFLGSKYSRYELTAYSDNYPIQDLVPNFYRQDVSRYDRERMPVDSTKTEALVRRTSRTWQASKGLANRHIALWHSHGWYYEQSLDRWEWQRARLFTTIEDLLPMSFTNPYLLPMLENAGANVLLPRERDIQTNMVIVDNDSRESGYRETAAPGRDWQTEKQAGFSIGKPPYTAGVNPFQQGSSRRVQVARTETATATWTADIPEAGEYAVYISYQHSPENVTGAQYTVHHLGGSTEFLVNQQMGGSTWIYLSHFSFKKGPHARVVLSNKSSEQGQFVSADAVRFGGGMGDVSREGQLSGRPRFVEAARYYLQFAGLPDTLVFSFNDEESDYRDDYQSRAEWVNYLRGAPYGPNKDRSVPGLGIPIDLSLAFHTDAGITRNDTVIGTLSIYSSDGDDDSRLFPDGVSRLANRDFADILQTQIVDDIRATVDPGWNRRFLWDRGYSEAYRPNVPAALLELLSHQNFYDMRYALEPEFRFQVSRSIYKSMLKFLASQHGVDYVVQPLPVDHFQVMLSDAGAAELRWQPVNDPLEHSAKADKYIVYTREEGRGFDNGRLVEEPFYSTDGLKAGKLYSFKVTAVNAGGESFPSEILSLCKVEGDNDPVLVINGFDRISAPAVIDAGGVSGFATFLDQGVSQGKDFNYIGDQYDFISASPWLDDDAPGHGASWAEYETEVIAGNSFDYPAIHGSAIRNAGRSFVSSSDEAVMEAQVDITQFNTVDLILGEEKKSAWPRDHLPVRFEAFPRKLRVALQHFRENGGDLFVSGAYLGSDLVGAEALDADVQFAADVLKLKFRTDHATRKGAVVSYENGFYPRFQEITFNVELNDQIYAVESPDAIEPADSSAITLMRYGSNNMSAAIGHHGEADLVAFGFPFETILSAKERDAIMKAVLAWLKE